MQHMPFVAFQRIGAPALLHADCVPVAQTSGFGPVSATAESFVPVSAVAESLLVEESFCVAPSVAVLASSPSVPPASSAVAAASVPSVLAGEPSSVEEQAATVANERRIERNGTRCRLGIDAN
jgi:hypothetical protein